MFAVYVNSRGLDLACRPYAATRSSGRIDGVEPLAYTAHAS
jgi:hypothetical protein